MYYHRPPPRPFPGARPPQQPRTDSATNLFNRVWQKSTSQHAEQCASTAPTVNPQLGGWRSYDPAPTSPTTPNATPMSRYVSLVSTAELVPPEPSPYIQPAPVPTPTQRLANIIPWSSGSTSQIYRTVIKRPQLMQMYMNDQLHTNAPDVENQFLAELRAYQTSGPHKHIASLLGCLEGIGMVIEQVDGDTLFDRVLKRNTGGKWDGIERVNTKLKVEWFNQLVEALVHVHQHGLSHGDINSLNILITTPTAHPPNIIKLIDFGRSTFYSPPGSPSHLPQSEVPHPPAHPFAAPEILRGGKYLDTKTYKKVPVDGRLCDAYSLGVLLWCLDEERLVEIDQATQRKEEVVLFAPSEDDDDGGDEADDESSDDGGTPPPQAKMIVDEGYFSGNNENGNATAMVMPRARRVRLFTKLIRGYMRRWEERTRIDLSQRMPVPGT